MKKAEKRQGDSVETMSKLSDGTFKGDESIFDKHGMTPRLLQMVGAS
jgi:hypothetical protein